MGAAAATAGTAGPFQVLLVVSSLLLYADDDIVRSTGSSSEEGEEDLLDPPVDVNEDDWVARYHEHIWRRAAGQVGGAADGISLVHCCTRTTRPRDLPGAGRRVSPMHGTRSQNTCCGCQGTGRVLYSCGENCCSR